MTTEGSPGDNGRSRRNQSKAVIGRSEERYAIGRLLGSGGMATVYLAHDLTLDRDVAIKVLQAQRAGDPAFVERFKREARAAGGLNHPNVVSIYDQGETREAAFGTGGHAYYIVMEYAPGGNLAEVVARRGALPEPEVLVLGAQIAAALDAAHSRGIVHRDVKPQNVLLTADGRVKVADFGIARAVDTRTLTRTSEVLGSAQYLSPEQAQGKPVDARSDVYSLGVVLYELLTGRPPFVADTPLAVALQHVNGAPVPLRVVNPALSPQVEAIVMKALAKAPDGRYPTAGAMRLALEDLHRSASIATAVTRTLPVSAAAAARSRPRAPRPVLAPRPAGPKRLSGAAYDGRLRRRHRLAAWSVVPAILLLFLAAAGVFAAARLATAMTASAGPGIVARSPTPVPSPTPLPLLAPLPPTTVPQPTATAQPPPTATTAPSPPTAVPTVATPAATPAPVIAPPTVAASPAPPAAVAPPPTALPTAVPTAAQQPAAAATGSAPASLSAATGPAQTVIQFYSLVGQHQFGQAAQLWTTTLQANFPPSADIDGRFAAVQQMTVRRAVVTAETARTATVAVDVVELDGGTPATRREYVGTWQLVRGAGGWLLNQPDLQAV